MLVPTKFRPCAASVTGRHILALTALLLSALLLSACTSSPTKSSPVYEVGETGPGGGVIFYVSKNHFSCGPNREERCTYLEASPSSVEKLLPWASGSETTYPDNNWSKPVPGADSVEIGAGYQNSLDIANQDGNYPDSAAVYALSLASGGFDDWFLPSKDELNEMYVQRDLLAPWTSQGYWSSSEVLSNSAWYQYFDTGTQTDFSKTKADLNTVRPIRAG